MRIFFRISTTPGADFGAEDRPNLRQTQALYRDLFAPEKRSMYSTAPQSELNWWVKKLLLQTLLAGLAFNSLFFMLPECVLLKKLDQHL